MNKSKILKIICLLFVVLMVILVAWKVSVNQSVIVPVILDTACSNQNCSACKDQNSCFESGCTWYKAFGTRPEMCVDSESKVIN